MAKPAFAPMKPIQRGAELLEAIGPQLNAVPAATAPSQPRLEEPAQLSSAPPQAARPAPFVLRLSPAVLQEIDAEASREGVTMTVIIARALKNAGFRVPEEDLKDRRKRRFRA